MEKIRSHECAELLGIKKNTFLRSIATQPDFPDRYGISRQNFYWDRSEFLEWEARRKKPRPSIKQIR